MTFWPLLVCTGLYVVTACGFARDGNGPHLRRVHAEDGALRRVDDGCAPHAGRGGRNELRLGRACALLARDQGTHACP